MVSYRLGQAARLLGVSVDTVRRLADRGRLATRRTAGGQRLIDGARLAKLAEAIDDDPELAPISSARNHLLGIVTRVVRDKVAAQDRASPIEEARGHFVHVWVGSWLHRARPPQVHTRDRKSRALMPCER